jgi:hypothetical protein
MGGKSMTQLIGILLIVNSLVVAAWLLGTGRAGATSSIILCTVAVFAGIALIIQDRIVEVTVKGVGTIKAAAEKAVTEAKEVSSIKERIEAQSATVDLVAKDAAEAKNLVEQLSRKNADAEQKLAKLDNSIQEGNRAVTALEAYTQFNSTVLAAQNDDRRAYDQLWTWSEDSTYSFQKPASQAVQTIMDQHDPAIIRSGFQVPWKEGVDPNKLQMKELWSAYKGAAPQIRIGILEFLWEKRTDIPKKDRLTFLIDVLRNDENLNVVEYAGRYFEQGTNDQIKPLAIRVHLKWWEDNKGSVK